MTKNKSLKEKNGELICPICQDILKEYDFPYDTLKNSKINYKCDTCGHKSTKIL